jgi:hypothetical protein
LCIYLDEEALRHCFEMLPTQQQGVYCLFIIECIISLLCKVQIGMRQDTHVRELMSACNNTSCAIHGESRNSEQVASPCILLQESPTSSQKLPSHQLSVSLTYNPSSHTFPHPLLSPLQNQASNPPMTPPDHRSFPFRPFRPFLFH